VRESDGVVIASDGVVENHRGQWVRHTSDAGVRDYAYDRLGRLVQVHDTGTLTGTCTTRTYGYDTHTNRTGSGTATGETGQGCLVVEQPTGTTAYDTADRLVASSADAGGAWVHDPLGRVTSMPSDGAQVTNGYFVNDRVASQEIAGSAKVAWAIDPLLRRSTFTSQAWTDGAWGASTTKISHYTSDSDEPSWIAEDAADATAVTRYVGGVEGDVAVTTSLTGQRELQLVDLHGDIVATLPIADGADQATWSGLAFTSFDEFGVAQPMSGSGASNAPPARYGWLGASQRSAEALGDVILMGARLYSPAVGRFLQVDPVPGGSATAYDYCNADPVNCTDLGGNWPSLKKILTAVAVVGEVASMIPGPVGVAAGVVAAGAYLATGDKKKAAMAMAGAALAVVGLGAVAKAGAAITARAARAGALLGRSAPKAARAVSSGAASVGKIEYGVYAVRATSGRMYVGMSKHISRRLAQHVANGRITPSAAAAAERTAVSGGRLQLRIAEQRKINSYPGGLRVLDNKINSIAKKHWPKYGISDPR
jgi:RHS repeat-associated protein